MNPMHTEGAAGPIRRDTVTVPAGALADQLGVQDNPGYCLLLFGLHRALTFCTTGAWAFHCHMAGHMEAGLAVVVIEAPLSAEKTTRLPQYMLDQCAAQGISPSGVSSQSNL